MDDATERLAEAWDWHQGELVVDRNSRIMQSGLSRKPRHRSEWDELNSNPGQENAIRALEDFRGGDE